VSNTPNSKVLTDSPSKPKIGAKPHRRLSLTRSTIEAPTHVFQVSPDALPPIDEEATSNAAFSSPPATVSGAPTRVMAYLTEEEAQALEDVWLRLRRHPSRPSKSDLLRAGLSFVLTDVESTKDVLTQQGSSTLIRQRARGGAKSP
jgi:hypothetical protein